MEKRLLLAIVISLFVVLTWSGLMSKLYPVAKQEVTAKKSPLITEQPLPSSLAITEIATDTSWERINLNNREIVFGLPYATVKEVRFKSFQNHSFSLQQGFWLKDKNLAFKLKALGTEPTFVYEDQEKRITKHFIFHNSNYDIGLDIIIQNLSTKDLTINYPLILGKIDLLQGQLASSFQQVVISQRENLLHLNLRKNFSSTEDLKFIAVKDRYFCFIVQPTLPGFKGFINKLNNKETEVGLNYPTNIPPGQQIKLSFHIYLGPQQLQVLNRINKEWGSIISYGTFDAISKLLLKVLEFVYNLVHNWGVAIIILSLLIYFILYPLTLKQLRSMKKMQELQPKIEALRQLYKDNPQRLNKEILELYKKEKANPFSGCLPLILQIPIFFALYQALIRSIELKGAKFLWIKDLSEPDRLIMLAKPLPLLGNEINILPVLMAILMFLQQKFSSVSAAGQSREQQRLMMVLFPFLFGFIFYRMPSGLVLYWFINTLLMVIYQSRIKFQH